MTPPPLAPRKKLSGFAIAAILAGVVVALAVNGFVATTYVLVKEMSLDLPEWVVYPRGTLVTGTVTARLQRLRIGHTNVRYETEDSVEKVAEYYTTEIARHGGQAITEALDIPGLGVHGILVKEANYKLSINILAARGHWTGIFISYSK